MQHKKNIFTGLVDCVNNIKGYEQKVVLINKKDILEYKISSFIPTAGGYQLTPILQHLIRFKLNGYTSGYPILNKTNVSIINAQYISKMKDDIPRYTHKVQFPLMGVNTKSKLALHSMNWADYFACVRHNNGEIEVYGWEFGLRPINTTIDGNDVGGIIQLESVEDEFFPPYKYVSPVVGNTNFDFDNNWNTFEPYPIGEYDDSYDDSFTIED